MPSSLAKNKQTILIQRRGYTICIRGSSFHLENTLIAYTSKLYCISNTLDFPFSHDWYKTLWEIWEKERIRVGRKDLGRKISIVRCLTAYWVQGDPEQVGSLVAELTEEVLRMVVSHV